GVREVNPKRREARQPPRRPGRATGRLRAVRRTVPPYPRRAARAGVSAPAAGERGRNDSPDVSGPHAGAREAREPAQTLRLVGEDSAAGAGETVVPPALALGFGMFGQLLDPFTG